MLLSLSIFIFVIVQDVSSASNPIEWIQHLLSETEYAVINNAEHTNFFECAAHCSENNATIVLPKNSDQTDFIFHAVFPKSIVTKAEQLKAATEEIDHAFKFSSTNGKKYEEAIKNRKTGHFFWLGTYNDVVNDEWISVAENDKTNSNNPQFSKTRPRVPATASSNATHYANWLPNGFFLESSLITPADAPKRARLNLGGQLPEPVPIISAIGTARRCAVFSGIYKKWVSAVCDYEKFDDRETYPYTMFAHGCMCERRISEEASLPNKSSFHSDFFAKDLPLLQKFFHDEPRCLGKSPCFPNTRFLDFDPTAIAIGKFGKAMELVAISFSACMLVLAIIQGAYRKFVSKNDRGNAETNVLKNGRKLRELPLSLKLMRIFPLYLTFFLEPEQDPEQESMLEYLNSDFDRSIAKNDPIDSSAKRDNFHAARRYSEVETMIAPDEESADNENYMSGKSKNKFPSVKLILDKYVLALICNGTIAARIFVDLYLQINLHDEFGELFLAYPMMLGWPPLILMAIETHLLLQKIVCRREKIWMNGILSDAFFAKNEKTLAKKVRLWLIPYSFMFMTFLAFGIQAGELSQWHWTYVAVLVMGPCLISFIASSFVADLKEIGDEVRNSVKNSNHDDNNSSIKIQKCSTISITKHTTARLSFKHAARVEYTRKLVSGFIVDYGAELLIISGVLVFFVFLRGDLIRWSPGLFPIIAVLCLLFVYLFIAYLQILARVGDEYSRFLQVLASLKIYVQNVPEYGNAKDLPAKNEGDVSSKQGVLSENPDSIDLTSTGALTEDIDTVYSYFSDPLIAKQFCFSLMGSMIDTGVVASVAGFMVVTVLLALVPQWISAG